MRGILLVFVVIWAVVSASGAFGQVAAPPMRLEPSPCPLMALRFIRPSMVPRLTKDLSLTDEQVAKFTELLNKADEALKPKIEDQRKAAKDFVTALTNPNAKEADMVSAFEKAVKAETAIAADSIKTMLALRALLTDQQKADFNKVIETRTSPWKREGMGIGPGIPAPMALPPPPPAVEQPKAAEPAK